MIRRHSSKRFQRTLISKLNCNSSKEVLTIGYENALLYITQSIDRLTNGEVQITDLVISKLLRQNIQKYTLFSVLVKAKLLDIPINVILLLCILRDFKSPDSIIKELAMILLKT
jgi:hypothetical protein